MDSRCVRRGAYAPTESRRLAALALLGLLASACASSGPGPAVQPETSGLDWSKFTTGLAGDPPTPGQVALDAWHKGSLHCAERRCSNLYELAIDKPGNVKIEVYAPLGRLPDFGVVLLDAEARVLAQSEEPGVRPRKLQARVEPGSYVIHVHALGEKDAGLRYEVISRLVVASASAPAQTKPQKAAPVPRSGVTPAPVQPSTPPPLPSAQPKVPTEGAPAATVAPAGRRGGVLAEVLDVEEQAGESAFVLLDAGTQQKVAAGMRGRLLAGDGSSLAEIEVVEVFPDGSRARILGKLAAPIGIDTRARIETAGKR